METKLMTKEEVLEYLNNSKIMCTSVEEAKIVQEKLFELGIEWLATGKTIALNTYLFHIINNYVKFTNDIEKWFRSENKRIEPIEILSIQIKEEEKPKFDPKVLLPFDKVLARNGSDRWHARFFDFYEDGVFYTASGEIWDMCIPYNEETKHLHGATAEEPEFYRGCK